VKEIRNAGLFQKTMARLRRQGKTVGLVPTMGALHEGHLSLVKAAGRENDVVVVSIFVNPFQFGPSEDLKKYPRPLARDRRLLEAVGADYLFRPEPEQMYPQDFSSYIETGVADSLRGAKSPLAGLTGVLCGRSRPGHFRGVATVVTKLFNLAKPHRAYFGAKDYQQSVIVRRLIRDLNFDIELRVLPTVREEDGLAMSSRNRYLSAADRLRAVVIPQTLLWVHRQLSSGERNVNRIKKMAKAKLRSKVTAIDYFEIVDPETLQPLEKIQLHMQVVTACFIGKTRLIDNVRIHLHG
jgi:pantoate--beta-alanine ligase